MSKADSAGKVIMKGARVTASGFVVRFGARIAFLFIAARLFGVGETLSMTNFADVPAGD
jgi:hypothetical protein